MTGGLLWTSSDHCHGVLTGLHDLRFLPLYWTLLDRAPKAGKPGWMAGKKTPCPHGHGHFTMPSDHEAPLSRLGGAQPASGEAR